MFSKKAMGLMLAVLLGVSLWTGCSCSANVKPNPTSAPTQKATTVPIASSTAVPTDGPSETPEASLMPDVSAGIDASASPEASDEAVGGGSITGGN